MDAVAGGTPNQRFVMSENHSCNYPNCDGGPATGYCHDQCRHEEPNYRLRCTNGHDRCYMGTDDDCPYCERIPDVGVNVDDELHKILGEAINAAKD